jgi:glycosyltransferase involved in cell wall biosynthesis
MKVLFITNWYPTRGFSYGGVFVREHAKAVRAAGNEVVVLHLARASKACRELWNMEEELDPGLNEGISAYHVHHRSMPLRGMSYPLYLWSAVKAFRRLRAEGFVPDVIHAHVYDAGVPAVMIGKRNGIPVVITEQFTGFPRRTLNRAAVRKARYAYRNADRALPVSMHLQRSIEAYGIEAKFEIVPNVADTAMFFTAPRKLKKADEKRMIFVGNLEPSQHKGYPTLLEALTLLGNLRGDWRLDVIGEGPERPEYQRRTEAAGLSGPVVFHEAKPKQEIAEMMRGSDLFVLPSRFDNLPCVVVEALASGLPVVSTTVGGIPEMVHEGAGILVPPDDPPALADALDSVLSNLGSYDRDKIAADARGRYSLEAVGAQLQRIYSSLLSASVTETEAGTSSPAES